MTPWGARLAVAGGFLVLCLCAVMVAKAWHAPRPQAKEMMKETMRGEVEWVKAQLKR